GGPAGLVAGYRFAEGSGISTADLTGNGNTGTLMNGPTWTTGQFGGGLSSNPADDGGIVAKLGGAGWQLKTSPDTGVRTAAIQISSNGSDSIQRYSKTVLATNTWYHLAAVYNATARTL